MVNITKSGGHLDFAPGLNFDNPQGKGLGRSACHGMKLDIPPRAIRGSRDKLDLQGPGGTLLTYPWCAVKMKDLRVMDLGGGVHCSTPSVSDNCVRTRCKIPIRVLSPPRTPTRKRRSCHWEKCRFPSQVCRERIHGILSSCLATCRSFRMGSTHGNLPISSRERSYHISYIIGSF